MCFNLESFFFTTFTTIVGFRFIPNMKSTFMFMASVYIVESIHLLPWFAQS